MAENRSPLDFELPPLPKLPSMEGTKEDSGFALPPLPRDPFAETGASSQQREMTPLDEGYVPKTELDVKKRVTELQAAEPEKKAPHEEGNMIFTDDYDPDSIFANGADADHIVDENGNRKLRLAPMTSSKRQSAMSLREQIKMGDLMMDMEDDKPILEDLSDDYTDPRDRKVSLAEQDSLDKEQKAQLRRAVKEDLSRVPIGFNMRASKRMEDKLREEQQLKIARKGMLLSFIPVFLGIISSALCIGLDFDWGQHQYIQYAGFLGVAGALLLLPRSKQTKMFGMIIYSICVLVYVIVSLLLYVFAAVQGDPEAGSMLHILASAASSVCLIAALLLLIKNEPINVYYSTKFKFKRD